ncbi:MAG: prepilin-type N-terminal cleavage/methylation domain-containing protein [Phycisphaerae bacterium]
MKRNAFTLLELLVVIGILALLVTLVIPFFRRAQEVARDTACKANLHYLGQGYATRGADTGSGTSLLKPVIAAPYQWPSLLADYVSQETAFVCPTAKAEGLQDGPWDGNPSGNHYQGVATAYGYELQVDFGGIFRLPFSDETPRMNRMPWDCVSPGKRWRGPSVDYPDPADPALIYEFVDDYGNRGVDWDAGNARNPENQFSFVYTEGKIDAIGWKVDAYRSKKMLYFGEEIPKWGSNTRRRNKSEWTAATYGMNSRANGMTFSEPEKILLVDYSKTVADVAGDLARDIWSREVRPRHSGRVNVLYVDGSVKGQDPDEVDPRVIEINDKHWRPEIDPPLGDNL